GWLEQQRGALVAGDAVTVDYTINRLGGCRADGFTLDGFAQFQPSGQVVSGSVVDGSGAAQSWTLAIPADATSVAFWFHNGDGSGCEGWDSNYGANWGFPVVAGAPPSVGWAGNYGGSTSRDCTHEDGIADPIVIDEYARERACLFVDADVWVAGVSDGDPAHPEWIMARVEWAKDGGATMTEWLADEGRVGNNERFRWQLPYELRDMTDWNTAQYSLEFSTDGVNWVGADGGVKRTIERDFQFSSD
ncbi:MAG TPA: DUF6209 family protein, partial [Polyangia bacterium]|nr:DUF6209 family protein [Polyangia bacterium]